MAFSKETLATAIEEGRAYFGTDGDRLPIEYRNGDNYEPDFVVETADACLLVEPKRADQISLDEVQTKARAALRWCGHANAHAAAHGGKRWHYLLVPDTAIQLGRSLATLFAEFEWQE